jgi:hypothetical protein
VEEEMFKRYPLMQRITGWIYSDLLEFHIKGQQYFRRSSWKQVFKADWRDFDIRFQGILENLQRHKNLAEYLARFAITNSSSDINLHIKEKLDTHGFDRTRLLKDLDKKEHDEREKKYWHVMEWLFPWRSIEEKLKRDQVSDHESFGEVRRQNLGSGDWMIQNATMASWIDDDTPRHLVLWLNGIPGAGELRVAINNKLMHNIGKTILASRVIDECKKRKDCTTSYFYCKDSDPQRNDSLSILKGLLIQMVTHERTLVPYFHMKAKSSGQETLVAHQLTQSLFGLACDRILKQFIIIDGLDECPREERRVLLSFLAEIVDKTETDDPGKLRILIVSQAEADIAETLSRESRTRPNFSVTQLAIQQKHNKDEIKNFVNMWINQIGQKFRLDSEETECIQRLMSLRTNGTSQH